MRSVWRLLAATCGIFLPLGALLCALALLLVPSRALAQSSVGQAANTATNRSVGDAIEQNLRDLIDREVLGAGAGTAAGGGAPAGGGVFSITAAPTGRVRTSDHDRLKVAVPNDNFSWDTQEASVFANLVVTLPGTVMGGQVKLAGFAGYNWLSLDLKSNSLFTLEEDQSGSAESGSVIAGGTALWAYKNMYALASVIGFWGETKLNDKIDDCTAALPPVCTLHRYKFSSGGFIGTATTGQVFPLSGSTTGPMLDLRGSISYLQNIGDAFLNFSGDQQIYKFSTWTGTGAATLYTNMTLPNSALLRPYVQAYVRQEVGYNNKLVAKENGGGPLSGNFHYEQAHTYGGVDVGLTYAVGKMTLGGAVYYDFSADDRTLGGRVGASWKLN